MSNLKKVQPGESLRIPGYRRGEGEAFDGANQSSQSPKYSQWASHRQRFDQGFSQRRMSAILASPAALGTGPRNETLSSPQNRSW